MHNAAEVQHQARRIEELIRKLESYREPGLVDAARELAQSVMELHAAALERMMQIVLQAGTAGSEILNSFGCDELAGTVLALYGLHPLDLETRVRRAMDSLQARARGHGSVELLGIDAGVVRIRVQATAPGCGSSAGTLKTAVEEAICQAAPDASVVMAAVKYFHGLEDGEVRLCYPNSAWLCLRRDVVDRLNRHKMRLGGPTCEEMLEGLLESAEQEVAQ